MKRHRLTSAETEAFGESGSSNFVLVRGEALVLQTYKETLFAFHHISNEDFSPRYSNQDLMFVSGRLWQTGMQ